MANSRILDYNHWTTSTRTWNITHVELWARDSNTYEDVFRVVGINKWCNRPWEKYDGESALREALGKLQASPENMQQVRECSSIGEAMEYLSEHLHIKLSGKKEYVYYQEYNT